MHESEKNQVKAVIFEFLEEIGLLSSEQIDIIKDFLGTKRNTLYKSFGNINDKLNPGALQSP